MSYHNKHSASGSSMSEGPKGRHLPREGEGQMQPDENKKKSYNFAYMLTFIYASLSFFRQR